jgi:peptide/nickel transport system substrate-binding protein
VRLSARKGVSRTVLVIAVAIILLVGAGAYVMLQGPGASQKSKASIVVEEESQPDTLDPAVTYVTPAWEVVEQIYQGLVSYNGTSYTTYQGVLAKDWTISDDGMTYLFNLRQDAKFSNGDPFNAYVIWFSIYRTLVMNQAPAWILGQNLAASNGENFNVTDAVLNSINYFSPSPANLTVMQYPNQSVQVINKYEIQLNLGYGYNGDGPYSAFLATLATPMAMAVDPAYVISNGGVVADQPNSKMQNSALGTGFYKLQSWIEGQSVSLVRNDNYWGNSLSASDLNNAISPAILKTVTIYYKTAAARVADLKSGFAQIIMAPATYYNVTTSLPGVSTSVLPDAFGSAEGVYYVYMDSSSFQPFSDLAVRKAVAHSIDYDSIIHVVFGDHATKWVGPVPPGFPFYDEATSAVNPYQYDPVLAAALLAQAGYVSRLPNGTTLNPSGRTLPTINFLFDSDSPTDTQAAQVIKTNLDAIGIKITLSPLPFRSYSTELYSQSGQNTTYPMGIGFYSEDYTASIDYVYYFTSGSYVGTSAYQDSQAMDWTTAASTALDDSTVVQSFQGITQLMHDNYVDIWLYVPNILAVNQNGVTGMIPNPAGSGAGYFLYYNTVNYTG